MKYLLQIVFIVVTTYGQMNDYTHILNYLEPIGGNNTRKLFGIFMKDSSKSCPNIHDPNSTNVRCVECQHLAICNNLNNKFIQEVYYPDSPDLTGTCDVIETLADHMTYELFGEGKSFRDSSICREIVMQYLCLFWGSNNFMYTNCCYYSEGNTAVGSNNLNPIITPRPPCRSFCLQIASLCANDDSFIQRCNSISCPQRTGHCTPYPTYQGHILRSTLDNCSIPYVQTVYKSSAVRGSTWGLHTTLPLFMLDSYMLMIIIACLSTIYMISYI